MKKTILIIGIIILLLSIIGGLITYFLLLHRYKGKDLNNPWSVTDEFKIDDISIIKKDKNKDFIILNLADIQMCDLEDYRYHKTIHDEISYFIDLYHPDLITLTGDQTWSNENLISLTQLIKWLDEYQIPYAPVFGNHDYGNDYDSAVAGIKKCCEIYENGKYSLFKRGPNNLGTLGNYLINIVEDDSIYATIYMLDLGYLDAFTDEQLAWIEWNAEGIKANNNGIYSQGITFFHKPIPEYRSAYFSYLEGESEALSDVIVTYSLYGSRQVNFYNLAKEIGIKDIVCGHQHGNCFTINYDGIRLTFALKTGELGGYYQDDDTYVNGASIFVLNNQDVIIKHHYLPDDYFHISDDFNVNND